MSAMRDPIQELLAWKKNLGSLLSKEKKDAPWVEECKKSIKSFIDFAWQEYKKIQNTPLAQSSAWALYSTSACDQLLRANDKSKTPEEMQLFLRDLIRSIDGAWLCHTLPACQADIIILSIGSRGDFPAQCPPYAEELAKQNKVAVYNFDLELGPDAERFLEEKKPTNLSIHHLDLYFEGLSKFSSGKFSFDQDGSFVNDMTRYYCRELENILTRTNKKIIFQEFTGPGCVADFARKLAQKYPDKLGSQLEILSGYYRGHPILKYSRDFILAQREPTKARYTDKDFEKMRTAWHKAQYGEAGFDSEGYKQLVTQPLDQLETEQSKKLFDKIEPNFRAIGTLYRNISSLPANILFRNNMESKASSSPAAHFNAPPKELNLDDLLKGRLQAQKGKHDALKKAFEEASNHYDQAPNDKNATAFQVSAGDLRKFYMVSLKGNDALLKTLEDEIDLKVKSKLYPSAKPKIGN